MQVVIIADDRLKEELLAFPMSNDLELNWVHKPGDLNIDISTDACIDLLFENNPERIQWLQQLHTSLVIINSVITPLETINEDFIRINGWPTFLRRPIIESAGKKEAKQKSAE